MLKKQSSSNINEPITTETKQDDPDTKQNIAVVAPNGS